MPRPQRVLIVSVLVVLVALILCLVPAASAQEPSSDPLQVSPTPMRSVAPPPTDAAAESLEQRGDELRAEKLYLDAADYYRAALQKKPESAVLYNKLGIDDLLLRRFPPAKKDFEHALKIDRGYADACNNLGVVFYIEKKYGKAISRYEQAIRLRDDAASFYSNLGAAYFSKKDFEKSVLAYSKALQLDPDVFDRSSRSGVAAQMSKPEDRAHYDYVVARLYAKMGQADRSLEYLRKALEEGYKDIDAVYKDQEFLSLRKDPRFVELMNARPVPIS
ncbi:MAG TPA: tetratricopeptide repeat protein [Terriglobales bacterium]|nr:tetratricopeptide repeat protein [Terriglobales bacterium]